MHARVQLRVQLWVLINAAGGAATAAGALEAYAMFAQRPCRGRQHPPHACRRLGRLRACMHGQRYGLIAWHYRISN